MSALPELSPLPDGKVAGMRKALAGPLNLRRDLYRFVSFVRREGLRRAYRSNGIPKGPASKLARLLSWPEEAAYVAQEGRGLWSDAVSRLAHQLGLVSFDLKGVYAGYSSQEPCFPDNDVEVQEKKLAAWLKAAPWEKEQAILTALAETTPSELFHGATLIPGRRFSSYGCDTGPASRMNLPAIRLRLLELLAQLPAETWLPMGAFIDLVRARAPTLILDPKLRQPLEKWEQKRQGGRVIEDLYCNFREGTVQDPWGRDRDPSLSENTKDVFLRVEGRYLQYFLQQIPYLCGFVDLAFDDTPAKPNDPLPPLQPVAAFRLSPRLAQLQRRDPEPSQVRVTVMPNFEVLVEAALFPDRELEALGPFCSLLKEDGPLHLLRLDRKAVVEQAASAKEPPKIRELLETLSGRPLPSNVAAELEDWCGHAEKLTIYEGAGLVELRGPPELRASVRSELGALLLDDGPEGFLLARDPERTLSVLEQRLRAPIAVTHSKAAFAACAGPLGSRREKSSPRSKRATAPRRVRLRAEDLVGYRSEDAALLAALHDSLRRAGSGCRLLKNEGLLLVPAGDLAEVRAALKRLGEQFDVELGR